MAGAPPMPPQFTLAVLTALQETHERLGSEPRHTFVAMMTAGALAGLFIDRTPEQMHAILDQTIEAARAIQKDVEPTKQ